MDVRGKTALVTGASSGIGRATAMALARAGARVLATGRTVAALEEVARATGGSFLALDLGREDAVERLSAWGSEADVLVNNAGVGAVRPLVETSPADAERVIRVNMTVPVLLTRAVLPGMLQRGQGHVVNVVSIAGHLGVRNEAVYSATKGGLIAFTESLRYELRGSDVGASVVTPGAVRTALFERGGAVYARRFPRPIRSEAVATAVLRAIRHDLPEVFAPRWMAVPARLRGALPSIYRVGASRWG